MLKSDFYYDLPEELIAQTPIPDRDRSRLLVIGKQDGSLTDRHFYDITDYLRPGDCLVINNTKVLPARIYGQTAHGGQMEFLLLLSRGDDVWETLARPGRKAVPGAEFVFGDGALRAKVLEVLENGNRVVKLSYDDPDFYGLLDRIGEMPLPHYIHERLEDQNRYQTVYCENPGSVAAPTAGLHFTPELLQKIRDMGVRIAEVTLNVGVGTFRPVKADNVEDHVMHSEQYVLPQEAADIINDTKKNGGRVIAVGTTSCRTLEGSFAKLGKTAADCGNTNIFIYPPYDFGVIDGLITNFHLPESTLIMLISAFAGRENILNAYRYAVQQRYRFFSFGDATLII
ncbi:MAG: tRNA preQ1(34) S-adenosylmethionine ribosyltransferase-isomerase QueA [Clostridia bacterium]|nr:tRNA preQ1(34) S-adenosylmethionine ribosyltransferase-isomerase QueA [Clostridia bacterium]